MGLFGFGKEEKKVKITDFFTTEDLEAIRSGAEAVRGSGSIPDLLGKGLIDYINRPEKEYGYSRFNKFIKVADSFRSFAPSLDEILRKGIEKYRAAGK